MMNNKYEEKSNSSDVVMYSTIRLMRNLSDTVFCDRMNNEQCRTVAKKVLACVKNSPLAKEFDMINLSQFDRAKALSYAEKRLVSDEFLQSGKPAYLLLSQNEDVSVMLCNEDHINITAFADGCNLMQAYNKANDVDDIFIGGLKIAYSDKYGFLTASSVNLGTGMRASVVLHLPALAQSKLIDKLTAMVSKLGMSLTPMYENGVGDIYILTNRVTLGITEKASIDNADAVCEQIINQERTARDMLKENPEFEDKIYRTLGILKLARRLSTDEFLSSISLVRLGTAMGYFDYSYSLLSDMLYNLFDATLVDSSKSDLTKEMCETLRAQIVREKLE